MTTVSLDQLRDNLRGLVERASSGEAIAIVDERQRTLAKIVSPADDSPYDPEAIRSGLIELRKAPHRRAEEFEPVEMPGKMASDMVIEDRR